MEVDDEILRELLKLPEFVEEVVRLLVSKLDTDEERLFELVKLRVGYRDKLGLCVVDVDEHVVNDTLEVAFDEAILEMLGDRETVVDGDWELESGTFTDIPRNEEGTQFAGGFETFAQGRA